MTRTMEYTGFGLAAISLILPAYSMPILGNVSLLQNWQGWLLLILICGGAVATVLGRRLWTRIASGVALALTAILLLLIVQDVNQASNLIGNMSRAGMSFGLSWAWGPLIVGLLAALLAPLSGNILKAK